MVKKNTLLESDKFINLKKHSNRMPSVLEDIFFFCATLGQEQSTVLNKSVYMTIIVLSGVISHFSDNFVISFAFNYLFAIFLLFYFYQAHTAFNNFKFNKEYTMIFYSLEFSEKENLRTFFNISTKENFFENLRVHVLDYFRKNQISEKNNLEKIEPI